MSHCCTIFPSFSYDEACNLTLFDEQGKPATISLFASTVVQFPGGFKIKSLNSELLVATGSGISYAEVAAQIAACNAGAGSSGSLDELSLLQLTDSGLEFTGGFIDRTTGTAGASDVGSNRLYTSADAAADRWILFGISETARDNNDVIYWSDPDTANLPGYDSTKGLFGGTQLPTAVDNLFDYDSTALTSDVTSGSGPIYTGAPGSLDFSTCLTGDKLECRFDFNVVPQIANTTLEVALIWATRDSSDNITFTFPLAAQPVFFGQGTVGRTFLNRPVMTAYFASNEDINAVALPAIKADNQIQIQPLTLLASIQR